MVAKKLVKCKELQQKKDDGGGKVVSRFSAFFSVQYFLLPFFLSSFPKNGYE